MICTASFEVAKQVLSGENFIKAGSALQALLLWGESVLTVNHGDWKKHRRIVGPAFSGTTYALAMRETVRLYYEMVEGEEWSKRDTVMVDAIDLHMSKFTLGIITRCGFGLPFPWVASGDDHEMPFEKALAVVSEEIILRLAAPRWAYKLPIKKLQHVDHAYRRLAKLMSSFIAAKKEEMASSMGDFAPAATDLFTRLISASEAQGKHGLNDEELIGNVFSFLFAGHETTAHASTATLALLALYEDEQEKVVQHIRQVLPDGRDPTFDDFAKLDKVMACFTEASRMFPGGAMLTRDTTATVVLKLPDEDGDKTLVVPPGMRILVDMIGIHYNERLFPDPERFDPSRWYGVQEVDLTSFGLGPRACLGRKFALTVGVCLLTLLLRDWKFTVPLKSGETKQRWRERVMQGRLVGLGFGVQNVPLIMTRRSKA
ncbi:hypothetical protein AcW1_002899 [Taiwanofungus camphoratus]|nr:hypothetical protein AcV5_001916 [Antrodia cinnamomea]KAI0942215.1 hypothetical protein AcW1_002899 [Antrodia cinnamomea]